MIKTIISTAILSDSNIRRTFRVVLERLGADYSIALDREIVPMLRDEIVKGGSEFQIFRRLEQIAKEQITLESGAAITGAQVAEAISKFGDKWDAEDHSL